MTKITREEGVMGKIISNQSGIIHAHAFCRDCSWDDDINIGQHDRMQKLRNRIYIHIRATGHTVDLETGNHTAYSHRKEPDNV